MEPRIFLSPESNSPNVKTYLNQLGTRKDLERTHLILKEGLRIAFYCDDAADDGTADDLLFDGTAHFDNEKKSWYVLLDPSSFHHRSEASRRKG